MKNRFAHIILLTFLFVIGFFQKNGMTQSKDSRIQISAGRSFSSFTAALPTDAGNDISYTYTTSPALINLTITSYGDYRISVSKQDSDWDNSLQFFIRRTGDGTSNGWRGNYISGGTNFTQLSSFTQILFEGRYTRYSIPIQYEFQNLSVLTPAGEHTSSVIYTITSL